MTDPPTEEQPWLGLSEAARVTGLGREAIRSRARRGLLPNRKSNRGEMLVQVPPGSVTEPDQGAPDQVADLLAEVTELRERLARAEAERDAAKTVAAAEVLAVKADGDAKERYIGQLERLLEAASRPWWRRMIG